ncbi:MAG: polyketide synthase [Nostoc sp. DedVER02]|uniref:type I polyketide synthase n=1 Tax=unclassified Nostoc TaxID=2593658 RepID=UPI002AD32B2A|nr:MULTISPECIES: polyketide synthase [unclassified Nostoc]MDZ7985846.1 beta-ketoacyl synthase N-terminal-like domain-containing protein [Nostoc sp. DedVER02]MDZ8114681.1 beta-ketoacyl synthase N-terminal-like domain-containing protein [Nostoc sp. DedVER01b]
MNTKTIFEETANLDIAIVGMSGRFPGAKSIDEFWHNLQTEVESISFLSDRELRDLNIEDKILKDPNYVKAASILEDIEYFDARFFGWSPKEAEIIDPQHRLFIESAWEALENAGYDPETYNGLIGVYAGVSTNSYFFNNLYNNANLIDVSNKYTFDKDFLTTHVSYKLNLKGPSVGVQTYCSTSLVAVHLACKSLLDEECDIALAGGVTIIVPQKSGYFYEKDGILSPDGHCRAFDAKAQGTVFGSGLGIVVLKRLQDAIADKDYIHAVIKGSAINNDGSLKVSYTAPSVNGQAEVIVEALANAGIDADDISYIETHGTGTTTGDPIEIAALTKAFRAFSKRNGFCAIGSVKPNIGHLDIASGVASLIKTVLALKNKQIPPSLNFETPNPEIDFANSPFYVNTKLTDWKTNNTPRRAGVSSLGFGGTNAHVILEEAPEIKYFDRSRPWQLILLSAKTSTALDTATENLGTYFKQYSNVNLSDVAYTLQVGRRAFNHRRILVCNSIQDAVKILETQEQERIFTVCQEHRKQPVIFMFSGQGAQYANMARELYEVEPVFAQHIDTCAEILEAYLNLDIRSLLYPREEDTETASKQLQQTALTQPALFVIEYALAQLFIEWGIHPQAMIGHSIGEYVAGAIAGVFSLKDALLIVAKRGQLMQQLPQGSMLAVKLPASHIQLLLEENLEIAVINSPSSSVVSGTNEAILQLQKQLISQGIECRLLHTSHAFHSAMMEPIREEFVQLVRKCKLHSPKINFISNVTGNWITDAEATNPNYWGQHLRQTVRFSDGISQLIKQFEGVFLEVGPGRTLSNLTTQHLDKNAKQQVLNSLRHVKEQQSDSGFLLQTLGRLWLSGVDIDWSGFYAHEQRHRLPLPTYPFERQRYWIDAKSPSLSLKNKQDIADWFYIPSWKRSLLPNSFSYQKESAPEAWLFFIDDLGIGDKLINLFINQDVNVITVKQAEQFRRISDGAYTINPYRCEDYEALFQDLKLHGRLTRNIAYLWSLSKLENRQSRKYLEFNSLLFLIQSFSKLNANSNLQLCIISNNIQDVNGNEMLDPEKAVILGLSKVIPQEYPNINCRCIDVGLTDRIDAENTEVREGDYGSIIIEQLVNELTAISSDLVVAYRDSYRWIQTFEPIRLEAIGKEKTPLRKEGVYLFPGGLKSTEVVIAEYLAKTLQAKLIFIEDSDFPEKNNFSQWLETHPQQDEVSCKIQKLVTLEKLGAKVFVISIDTSNEQQIHQSFSSENIAQINGVIYSTGIKSEHIFGSIPEIDNIESEKLFEFQRDRVNILEQILENQTLDFCIIFSSFSSILGGFGLGLDSAANHFIDTFTNEHNRNNNLPWDIINWDKLEINSSEAPGSELAIDATKTVEAFKRIFSLKRGTQILISPVDINARKNHIISLDSTKNFTNLNKLDPSPRYFRPNLSNAYIAPTNELEKQITEIWQEVLGITEVGIYDNFYDLGGDSLIATQLVSRLRAKFPVELPLREFLLQAMIPAKQAEMIEYLLLEKIEELSEEEVELLLNNS